MKAATLAISSNVISRRGWVLRHPSQRARQPGAGAEPTGDGTAMSARETLIRPLRRQYGCGPVELASSADALYDRHLFSTTWPWRDPAGRGRRGQVAIDGHRD